MTTRAAQLAGLARLTDAAFKARQAEMAILKQTEAALRATIAALNAPKPHRPGDDPATMAGADANWQIWVDQRRRALNLELARLLAAQERLRHDLGQAFGRDQAIRALAKQQNAQTVLARARKSE